MYNIKPVIRELLEEIPNVNVSYLNPSDMAKLPAIVYSEMNFQANPGAEERFVDETIFIDIYAQGSTTAIAEKVNEKMYTIGLSRQFAKDIGDTSGLIHRSMRFHGVLDTTTMNMYQSF